MANSLDQTWLDSIFPPAIADECLKCSLTYGLPQVFERHPLLAVGKAAGQIAEKLGFGKDYRWELGATGERGPELHEIPFVVEKA